MKNRGGHSSVPARDNAIYHLAEGLVRLSKFSFPQKLNETTRAYFERTAQFENEQTAADIRAALSDKPDPSAMSFTRLAANPVYNAQLRTTCVATMLEGGHAINALPQLATRQGQLPHHARRRRSTRSRRRWSACSRTTRSP